MVNSFRQQVAGTPPRMGPAPGAEQGAHTVEGLCSAVGRQDAPVLSRLPGHGKLLVRFHFSKLCDFSMRCSGNASAGTAKRADVLGTKSVSSGNTEMVTVELQSGIISTDDDCCQPCTIHPSIHPSVHPSLPPSTCNCKQTDIAHAHSRAV